MQESIKKVPLPAVMFNRTPNKERKTNNMSNSKLFSHTPTRNASPSINSSRRKWLDQKENSKMGNSRIEGEPCMNHQYKEATFYIDGECGKYCQKCAIFMASQGYKVRKVSSNNDQLTYQRKQQLDKVAKQVDQTLRILGTKKVQTTQCQIHCKQTFQQQSQIAEQYFMQLHKVIDYYRQQTLKCIQNEFTQSQIIQQQLQQIIQQSISESNSMKYRLSPKDINSVYNYDSQKFDTTLQLFKMRLNNYKKTVKSWKAQDIVIKPINLCDINHMSAILNDLYNPNIILFQQPQSQYRQQVQYDDVIPQQETMTEDDIQM